MATDPCVSARHGPDALALLLVMTRRNLPKQCSSCNPPREDDRPRPQFEESTRSHDDNSHLDGYDTSTSGIKQGEYNPQRVPLDGWESETVRSGLVILSRIGKNNNGAGTSGHANKKPDASVAVSLHSHRIMPANTSSTNHWTRAFRLTANRVRVIFGVTFMLRVQLSVFLTGDNL
ncbi:hypothetical protein Tco_1152557 [Tanacetum coccineum]